MTAHRRVCRKPRQDGAASQGTRRTPRPPRVRCPRLPRTPAISPTAVRRQTQVRWQTPARRRVQARGLQLEARRREMAHSAAAAPNRAIVGVNIVSTPCAARALRVRSASAVDRKALVKTSRLEARTLRAAQRTWRATPRVAARLSRAPNARPTTIARRRIVQRRARSWAMHPKSYAARRTAASARLAVVKAPGAVQYISRPCRAALAARFARMASA